MIMKDTSERTVVSSEQPQGSTSCMLPVWGAILIDDILRQACNVLQTLYSLCVVDRRMIRSCRIALPSNVGPAA